MALFLLARCSAWGRQEHFRRIALSSTAVLSPVTAAVLCGAHRLICFELDETSIPERLMRSCSGFLTRKKFLIP